MQAVSRLEGKYLGNGTRSTEMVPRQAAHFIMKHDNVQYFAVESGRACPSGALTNNFLAPVVVTIGANYSQGPNRLPASSPSGMVQVWPFVEDKLSAIRRRLDGYFDLYNTKNLPGIWRTEAGYELSQYAKLDQTIPQFANDPWPTMPDALPGTIPTPRGHYHLVLANFSPWITTQPWSWSKIRDQHPSEAATIFDHPPHGERTLVEFDHLRKLLPANTIWVGHGNYDVHALFMDLINRWKLEEWFFRSNLGYP